MIFHHPDLICAFSRRPENMSLSCGDTRNALNNRKDFLTRLGIDSSDLVCCQQVHSNHVHYAKKRDRGRGALAHAQALGETDALITKQRNLPLAVFTADCLSVFFCSPTTNGIGLAHAGWKGSRGKIVVRTAQLMQEKFKIKPQDLWIGLGPAIRDCCYEVGKEFRTYFKDGLTVKKGRYYLDLIGINKRQLLGLGVREENIFDSGICTSCENNDFFSFRREGAGCGRIISVIMSR